MLPYTATLDKMLSGTRIPRVMKVSESFSDVHEPDLDGKLGKLLPEKFPQDLRGKRIAVTCGSRGVDRYLDILRAVVRFLKEKGAEPMLIPAMGSHGGATAEGQTEMLHHFGITEDTIGAKIYSSMEVVEIGRTERDMPVYVDRYACESDGIILFNRIKPHTSFRGTYESGLIKIMVIGLGKQKGAEATHFLRFANMPGNLESAAHIIYDRLPILGGVATIENGYGHLAEVDALAREELFEKEPVILKKAFSLMPRIYLDNIDVLIVKEIGKDVSGTGMDTNIIGRYHTNCAYGGPNVTKLGILDLSEKSGGNANGMGLSDFVTERLYDKIDFEALYVNTLTSGEPTSSRLPMVLSSDRSVIQACVKQCGVFDPQKIKMVMIRSTKHLDSIYLSEAAFEANCGGERVKQAGGLFDLEFDANGNLGDLF